MVTKTVARGDNLGIEFQIPNQYYRFCLAFEIFNALMLIDSKTEKYGNDIQMYAFAESEQFWPF